MFVAISPAAPVFGAPTVPDEFEDVSPVEVPPVEDPPVEVPPVVPVTVPDPDVSVVPYVVVLCAAAMPAVNKNARAVPLMIFLSSISISY
jgi:hypothetical protein